MRRKRENRRSGWFIEFLNLDNNRKGEESMNIELVGTKEPTTAEKVKSLLDDLYDVSGRPQNNERFDNKVSKAIQALLALRSSL